MAYKQLTLELDGNAQSLSGAVAGTWNDPPIRQIGIQADSANANIVYIGDTDIDADDYSAYIPVPPSNVPFGPLVMDIPPGAVVRLSEIYVKGTNTQKVHGWVIY